MNLFEIATRQAFRFPSTKGPLTTEQLWDLPLQSRTSFDLDSVAKAVNAQLKAVTEESFVATTEKPGKALAERQLEIVKHIIAVKIEENERAKTIAERKAKREKLLGLLEKKQDATLEGMSVEQIKAELAALD